jgi:SprT-like family.
MGLQGLIDQEKGDVPERAWPDHKRQDELEEWLDDLENEIPIELDVDFIEVSPPMTQTAAMAYKDSSDNKDREYYIRVSEWVMENEPDDVIRGTILHELAHIWFWENGDGDISDGDDMFSYVLGGLGAHLSGVDFKGYEYETYMKHLTDVY